MNRWEARKARTRRTIIDAAMGIFLAGGYLATTVEELIEAAGVSRSTFYSHFPNKLELLNAIAADNVEHRAIRFRTLAELPEITEESVSAWLDEGARDARSNSEAIRLFRLAVGLDARIMRQFTLARDTFTLILAPRFRGFDIRSGNDREKEERRAAAHFFVISIEQFFSSLSDDSWIIDFDITKQHVIRQLLANV
jgi:AcrR family transcriptional regulator